MDASSTQLSSDPFVSAQRLEFHVAPAGWDGAGAVAHFGESAGDKFTERVGIRAVQVDDQGHSDSNRFTLRI